jgi:hypothetical protein
MMWRREDRLVLQQVVQAQKDENANKAKREAAAQRMRNEGAVDGAMSTLIRYFDLAGFARPTLGYVKSYGWRTRGDHTSEIIITVSMKGEG